MQAARTVATFDVLIAGAGPAGAVAALNLAPTRSVVIAERRAKPMARVGESLPPVARWPLTDMGLFDAFVDEGHAPSHGNRSLWGSETVTTTDFLRDPDGHGWHLDRARFEAWMRECATERGATLLAPAELVAVERRDLLWRARLSTPSGVRDVEAHVLIDAAGRKGRVARRVDARRISLDKLLCRWVHGRESGGGRGAGHSYVESSPDGWWYTAPLPDGRRVLAFHTDADLPAADSTGDPDALARQAREAPELSAVLSEAGFVPDGGVGGTTAAHGSLLYPCAGPAWLAAGDAAMSFDPLSSQGLLNALVSGLAAAEATSRHLAGDTTGWPDYAAMIARVYECYRDHLESAYALETRWPDAPFWRRRLPR